MSWWAAAPDAFALALLVLLPGGLALRLLGVRGLSALAGAPPVTLGALGVLAVAYAPLGVPWRLPAVLAGLLVLLGVLALLARGLRLPAGPGPGPLGRRGRLAVGAGLAVGAALLALPFLTVLPAADSPLQQWDAVFHLNAVVSARETGVITPLGGLAPLYGDGSGSPYYPTGWHSLVALAPGDSVPAATNTAVLVLGMGTWVLGLTGLAREVLTRAVLPAVLAPLLAAGFIAYPAVQLTVLAQLPNGLSTALLPGALLLVVRAVRAARARQGVVGAGLAAVLAAAGVVVAHASGAFSLAVLAGPLVIGALGGWALAQVRQGRRALGGGVLLALVAVVVGTPLLLANLDALSSVTGFERASGRSHRAALQEVLLDNALVHWFPGDGWQHVAVTVATLAGAVLTLVRRRHRWLTVALALAVGLSVLAAGPEDHPLRWLSGFWYTQAGRIAPVAVVPAVLLAAYALTALVERRGVPAAVPQNSAVARKSAVARNSAVARKSAVAGEVGVGGAVLVGVLVLVLGTAVLRLPLQERVVASAYVPGEVAWGTMATDEELAMMRRLGQSLPPGAVVVGDPFNGSALLPAVAGVDVVFPQLGAGGRSPAQEVLEERLADVHDDPAVCAALREVGATHLYQDTATARDGAKQRDRTDGMQDVDVTRGFTEVDSAGTASVHRIEVCG